MGFLNALRRGKEGIHLAFPSGCRVLEEGDGDVTLESAGTNMIWHVRRGFELLDLRPEFDAALRRDFEIHAREAFNLHFKQTRREAAFQKTEPRTNDPGWSPIVEFERFDHAGTPILRMIHRLAYEPGKEVVLGHVMIPTKDATYEISAVSRAQTTGYRESVLFMKFMDAHPNADPERLVKEWPQGEKDAAEHDPLFPEHPLSCVRAGLKRLLNSGEAGLKVLNPFSTRFGREIELPQAGCAVSLPPRYVFCPTLARNLSPTLAPFTRLSLPGVAFEFQPRMLDVWRMPERIAPGSQSAMRLKTLASETLRGWEREGASDIRSEIEIVSATGRVSVASFVRFSTVAGPTQSHSLWFLDDEGCVYRISVGGPPFLAREELVSDVDEVFRSWRPIPFVDPIPSSEKRAWWQFWK